MYPRRGYRQIEARMDQMLAMLDRERRSFSAEERREWHGLVEQHEGVTASRDVDRYQASLRGGNRISELGGLDSDAMSVEEMRDTFRFSAAGKKERDRSPEGRAFSNFLRFGISALSEDDKEIMRNRFDPGNALARGIRNAQTTLVGSGGGYIVPIGFSDKLMEALKWYGGIVGVVSEFETESGQPLPWPTIDDVNNMGRVVGQNTQVVETDFVFSQVTFNAYILSSDIVLIPIALMEDSYFDLDALVARLLGVRLGRLINNQATLGTGTTTLTGIVPAVVASGNIYQLPAGNTASIAYPYLVNLEHSIDPAYRYQPSARWMFHDSMLKLLKQLVDGNNRPLWQPGLTASFREGAVVDFSADSPTILGHPYIVNQDMAPPSANGYSMLFGDMSTFKLRKVGQVAVQRLVERYADYLQVGFQAFIRCDSNLIDAGTHPIAAMQQSAT